MYMKKEKLWKLFEQTLQESGTSTPAAIRKGYMDEIKKHIRENLPKFEKFIFPQSNRHGSEEIDRIQVGNLSEEGPSVKEALEEIFGERKGDYFEIESAQYGTIKFKCDFDHVMGPSGTYLTFKVDFEDSLQFEPAYIIDCTAPIKGTNKFGKKLFTPNNVLPKSCLGKWITPEELIENISYGKDSKKDDVRLTTLLKELAKSAQSNSKSENERLINYLVGSADDKGNEDVPSGALDINFTANDELKKIIEEIGIDGMQKLSAAIYVDFGEVLGAISLAKVLSKNKKVNIKFPEGSNEPLVDYFLGSGDSDQDNEQAFKVSAKAGAGGKPTLNKPCETILSMIGDNRNDYDKDTILFIEWIKDCLNGTVHSSFKKMADDFSSMVEGTFEKNFLKETKQWKKLENNKENIQKNIIELSLNLKEDAQETLKTLVDNTNEILKEVIGDTVKKGIGLSKVQATGIWSEEKLNAFGKENVQTYFDSLKIKCLVTILINIINNSKLMENFNILFNKSFGTFLQIYFKNTGKTISGDSIFTLSGVPKSVNGRNISGMKAEYKLVFDCNIDAKTGIFKTKTLAMKLMHEINETTLYRNELKALKEKYNQFKRNKLFEKLYKVYNSKRLNEETAKKYFNFLIEQGLKEIDFSQSGENLDAELDHTNIVSRYNDQIRNRDIEKDYFEGKTFQEFKTNFLDFINGQDSLKEDSKLKRQVMTVFNNYCGWFSEKSSKLDADWKDKK